MRLGVLERVHEDWCYYFALFGIVLQRECSVVPKPRILSVLDRANQRRQQCRLLVQRQPIEKALLILTRIEITKSDLRTLLDSSFLTV